MRDTRLLVLLLTPALLPGRAGAADPPLHTLELPAGFSIEVHTDQVPNARAMALGAGGTLFVGTRRPSPARSPIGPLAQGQHRGGRGLPGGLLPACGLDSARTAARSRLVGCWAMFAPRCSPPAKKRP